MYAYMNRRAVFTSLLTAFVVAFAACSGGDKAQPSDEGQPDYLDRVADLFQRLDSETALAGCAVNPPAPTPQHCDRPAVVRAGAEFGDAWKHLVPPRDVALEHAELGRRLEGTLALEAIPTEEISDRVKQDPEILDPAIHFKTSYDAWRNAVSAHYGVLVFGVEGSSMAPALCAKDLVFAQLSYETIERWSILVFKFPLDESRDFIKRVVGLPGDVIEVKDGIISVNGAPLDDDVYAKDPPNYKYLPKTVPADSYFVLGDNRRNSYDSHAWGASCDAKKQCDFVPKVDILGVLPADTKGCKDKTGS